MNKRFFGWLYRKLFGNGQAYRGYWHWTLADLVKRLANIPCGKTGGVAQAEQWSG